MVEEKTIQRLGGTRDIDVDVRILATTNSVIEDEIRKGKFRHDLFHRLDQSTIDVPPLRERKEDIPLLAEEFLHEICAQCGKKVESFSSDAMEYIFSHPWPGNVRELKNVIRKAVLIAESGHITVSCLPESMVDRPHNEVEDSSFPLTLEDSEREAVIRALEKAKCNVSLASKILGISRQALYRKIKRFEL